jgi:hypothetical protein
MTAPKKASTQPECPYTWEEISPKLGLTSNQEIPKFILSTDFLGPWIQLRDLMPLQPSVLVPTLPAPKDKEAMNELVNKVYESMDAMHTSPYDRPSSSDRKEWGPAQFIECLIYQSSRNLAREGHTIHTPFLRSNLKNEAGHREAFHRLRGLVMLVSNLCINYTLMGPSNIIRRVEATKPAKYPSLSPIAEVRVKWHLDHMGVDELRKKVLNSERQEKEEKEWLINILMGKEVPPKAVGSAEKGSPEFVVKKEEIIEVLEVKSKGKKEGSVEGGGRKRALSTTDEENAKRARTVS